jgi:hypothetical protein
MSKETKSCRIPTLQQPSAFIGVVIIVLVALQLVLGRVWTRNGPTLYRKVDPRKFYASVVFQLFLAALFFGAAIYYHTKPIPPKIQHNG